MDSFIATGLNDTSLPFTRDDLSKTFSIHEFQEFQRWQECVLSDTLNITKGGHARLNNGDTLFERKPPRLGVGSSG